MSRTRSRTPIITPSTDPGSAVESDPVISLTPEPKKKRTSSGKSRASKPPASRLRVVTDVNLHEVEPDLLSSRMEAFTKMRSRRRAPSKRVIVPSVGSKSWLSSVMDLMVDQDVDDRMRDILTDVNEYGYDPWGLHPQTARYGYSVFAWLYKHYWRVKVTGIENVPQGRVLLIANHSGQIPIDGIMISVSMLLEAEPPRLARAMIERWFSQIPIMGTFIARNGSIVGDPLNCERLLSKGEAILVFPEGIRGSGKLWRDRYKLMRFGLGFMRLALATNTPIVPIGVIGGEEQAPALMNAKPVAKMLGLPYLPITPTFPWLGLLGAIPYPTKYHIYFGEPLTFRGPADDRDEVIQKKVDVVKAAIRQLIDRGLEERESIF